MGPHEVPRRHSLLGRTSAAAKWTGLPNSGFILWFKHKQIYVYVMGFFLSCTLSGIKAVHAMLSHGHPFARDLCHSVIARALRALLRGETRSNICNLVQTNLRGMSHYLRRWAYRDEFQFEESFLFQIEISFPLQFD